MAATVWHAVMIAAAAARVVPVLPRSSSVCIVYCEREGSLVWVQGQLGAQDAVETARAQLILIMHDTPPDHAPSPQVAKFTTEADLRRIVAQNIKRLKDIGCYRGRRHIVVRWLT